MIQQALKYTQLNCTTVNYSMILHPPPLCSVDLLSSSGRPLLSSLFSPVQLKVVKQGDSCEDAMQRRLVEDKSPNGGASYADFLYHLHVHSLRLLG